MTGRCGAVLVKGLASSAVILLLCSDGLGIYVAVWKKEIFIKTGEQPRKKEIAAVVKRCVYTSRLFLYVIGKRADVLGSSG
jgi:succinate dehydrogenase/fumarate reductase cytochrome b subunit